MIINSADAGRAIDEIFEQFNKPGLPGAAVALLADGAALYQSGYGLADLEHQVAITPSTVFNIGSESKQFTAMAALILEEEGRLSLDDEVQKHLPDFPNFPEPITIRNLIHHTSGLRDLIPLSVLAGWREGDVTTSEDILKLVQMQQELNFFPGEEFDYSNTGYLILAQIIEHVSGETFANYCQAQIFKPLGMDNSLCHDNYAMVIPNRAHGYYYDEESDTYFNSVLSDTVLGPTNVYTNVEDLARWDENFYTGEVGGLDLIKRLYQPGRLNSGTELDYAFGLFIGHQYRGLDIVEHGGGQGGYVSQIVRFPDQHFSVVVLINHFTWEARTYALRVADVYIDAVELPRVDRAEYKPQKSTTPAFTLDSVQLQDYAGTYVNFSRAAVREVIYQGESLKLFGMDLIPVNGNEFFLEQEPNVKVTFGPPLVNEVAEMWIDSGTTNFCYEKVEKGEMSSKKLEEYAGRYYCPELDIYWTILLKGDQLLVNRRKYVSTQLAQLFKDAFIDNWLPFTFWPEQGMLFFNRNSDGAIIGLSVSCDRIRNLKFQRN